MKNFVLRILIADDHPAVLAGIESVLEEKNEIEIVGRAKNSTEIINFLRQNECDVLVTDYSMPGGTYGDGLVMLNVIRRRFPGVKIVMLTMIENIGIIKSLANQGIYRIVHKTDSLGSLVPAIYAAYTDGQFISPSASKLLGGEWLGAVRTSIELSKREEEVLLLFISGMTVSEIAKKLYRSIKTVSTHKVAVMNKLGIRKDIDLIRYGIEMGWIDARK
ncbi:MULTISPECIES: response regulator transcription factor [Delftia]|jgi:two-component system capsular synthesis response regulator RcsB|uniref:DNA-binding response regulator n=4 Tax=Pseudomonadota TaxID=1224 RepID=A0AAX3SBC3_9BURK|nr:MULTISPECIES: response regulator transcription factor [Delftia]KAA9173427.1 response regulator transcription factor [Delftia sp. BR1]KEH09204.1 LuxR family transcriptional regulator [Delftia sp. 670]MCC5641363.1 response regulator transcription factor [Nostoc sp. CHAB 5844]AOV00882.1 DNA-binding response regulator [Delftia tsuruhatensis]EPD40567.1 two-component system, NarL family, captular synthesis response regulator RcsB [Delftia acidovorans CCUG 274B]